MPIIIWGTRGITSTSGSGNFFCPRCNNERYYQHKSVRRFFTLYFIPLIPLDHLGEYVECQTCRTTYNTNVLSFNPMKQKHFEAEFHIAIKRVLVQMVLADGAVDDKEIEMVQSIYAKITNTSLSTEQVQAEIETAQAEGIGVEKFLSSMAGKLNDAGKDLVLQAAIFVAGADGEFQEGEVAMLESIGKALLMPPDKIKALIQKIRTQNGA